MTGAIDLHAAAALHFRLLSANDTSGQAELLALVHAVLAGEEGCDEGFELQSAGSVHPTAVESLHPAPTPCRS